MELAPNIWLEKGFYIDIDHLGQLRVVGPGDHLYFGMINEKEERNFEIFRVYLKENRLFITGNFYGSRIKFFYPIMGDIRTVRAYSFLKYKKNNTFYDIRKKFSDVLAPEKIKEIRKDGFTALTFERNFGNNYYGSKLILKDGINITKNDTHLTLKNGGPVIPFKIEIYDNNFFKPSFFLNPFKEKILDFKNLNSRQELTENILKRTEIEISHLLKYRKTSSYDYGTVFPRDWTETAVLGCDDFSEEALRYILTQSLKYVTPSGKGWHEKCVGEYAYNSSLSHVPLITREMIDIEPRYILAFGMFPEVFKNDEILLKKIQKVASFIFCKAKEYPVIKFGRVKFQIAELNHNGEAKTVSFKAGNWRDSASAYLHVSSDVIPFDVNAVFYPAALKVIKEHADILNIKDKNLDKIVSSWENKKDLFRFKNKDGLTAYALALYDFNDDKDYKKLEVNHTDEAYNLIFNKPSDEDVKSFAARILDSNYFYTKSGPMIVGRNQGYSSLQYHGEVIWLKQVGLCSMGFKKQLLRKDISEGTKKIIKEAIGYLFNSLTYMFGYLDLLPELIVDKRGAPILYNNQELVEGHMNKIQLWSSEAARRIILDYYDILRG